MVRTLVDSHDEDAGLIEVDVRQIVRKLTDLGLVVDVAEHGEAEDGEAAAEG